MQTRGQLRQNIDVLYPSRKAVITFEVTATPAECERYIGKDCDVTFSVHHDKRSKRANAYYWELNGQTANAMNSAQVRKDSVTYQKLRNAGIEKISSTSLHNMMLRDFGKPLLVQGKLVTVQIPDNDDAERLALESETFHIKPTSNCVTNSKGTRYRTYVVLCGSHDMNTKEFSQLLDRMIIEAQGQGIETLTPNEIAQMKADMEQR